MLRLLSALLLVALASASGQPSFRLSIQVVNCSEADPHSWPWQAMVLYEEDGNLYFICGGTLIDPDWVMTAGHCFPYTRTYWVLLGAHDITNLGDKEQIIPGEKIIVHPDYDDNDVSKGNDIALIKLSHSAEVTEEVQPACLAPRDYILPNGTQCYITGWGTTSTRGSVSNVLHQCLMKVVDYAHCSQPDWWGSTVKETMMCSCCDIAGCICDSGAPLICRIGKGVWKVYGVASFVSANGCVTPQKPTVFTRVSAFIPWIIGTICSSLKCPC